MSEQVSKEPQPAGTEGVQDTSTAPKTFDEKYVKELRSENAGYRTKLREFEQHFDSSEDAAVAAKLWRTASTDDGLKQIMVEAGQVLKVSPEKLAALWAEDVADPTTTTSATDAVTPESLKTLLETEVRQPLDQFRAEQLAEKRRDAIVGVLDKFEDLSPEDKYDVLAYANKYVEEDSSPAEMADAVKKGYADWTGRLEAFGSLAVDKYLKSKAKDADVPAGLSGSASVTGETPAPAKSAAEAGENLRRRLGIIK